MNALSIDAPPMLPHGSRLTRSKPLEKTRLPPYWGLPSLSHQLPVPLAVLVGVVVTLVVVVVVLETATDVVVVVVVRVVVVVVVVVVVPQDAKTSDDTMRKVSAIQKAPLFIQTS
jgi:hypothetical protein